MIAVDAQPLLDELEVLELLEEELDEELLLDEELELEELEELLLDELEELLEVEPLEPTQLGAMKLPSWFPWKPKTFVAVWPGAGNCQP